MIYEGLYNSAVDKGLQSPEAYANANIDTYAGIPELGYTDWRKELIRTAHNQNYEVTASGGNERTTFYASLGFNRQEGLVENSNLDRYSARLNMTHKMGSRVEVGGSPR